MVKRNVSCRCFVSAVKHSSPLVGPPSVIYPILIPLRRDVATFVSLSQTHLQVIVMLSRILAIVAVGLFSMLATSASAQGTLKISAIPDEAPTELQRKFVPLGKYLEQQTGMKVEFIPVTDYAAVVESLATGSIDMAWLGGFTFVAGRKRTKWGAVTVLQG